MPVPRTIRRTSITVATALMRRGAGRGDRQCGPVAVESAEPLCFRDGHEFRRSRPRGGALPVRLPRLLGRLRGFQLRTGRLHEPARRRRRGLGGIRERTHRETVPAQGLRTLHAGLIPIRRMKVSCHVRCRPLVPNRDGRRRCGAGLRRHDRDSQRDAGVSDVRPGRSGNPRLRPDPPRPMRPRPSLVRRNSWPSSCRR